jgi:hypothetical protein
VDEEGLQPTLELASIDVCHCTRGLY